MQFTLSRMWQPDVSPLSSILLDQWSNNDLDTVIDSWYYRNQPE